MTIKLDAIIVSNNKKGVVGYVIPHIYYPQYYYKKTTIY